MGAGNHITSLPVFSSLPHCLAAGDALCARRGEASVAGPAQGHRHSAQKSRGESELEQPRSGHLLILADAVLEN